MKKTPEDIIISQMYTIHDSHMMYYFTQVYHKQQSHDAWFLRYQPRQTEFFDILDHFLPFYSPNNLRNQNFEKIKKTPEDIIILHMCILNDNHI